MVIHPIYCTTYAVINYPFFYTILPYISKFDYQTIANGNPYKH